MRLHVDKSSWAVARTKPGCNLLTPGMGAGAIGFEMRSDP